MTTRIRPDFVPLSTFTTGAKVGPAAYVAGGVGVDLSAIFSSLTFFAVICTTVGPNLPPVEYHYALNSPAAGQAKFKPMRKRFDRFTFGSTTGSPGGVTVNAAATTTTSDAGHTHVSQGGHTGHGLVSTVMDAKLVDVLGAGTAQNTLHDHAAAGGAHTHPAVAAHPHSIPSLYEHQHGVTVPVQTQTNVASVEVAAGVDLSGTTWRFVAKGVLL